jgi:aspartokinase/homoserine dehydrogenase 1
MAALRPHVHKLGGASLADAPAFRRAVALLRDQPKPIVVVVSAIAGVTDTLLEIAQQAVGGDYASVAGATAALEDRHARIARAIARPGPRRARLLKSIRESCFELEGLARGLSLVRELTPRIRDHIVARGERLSALLFAEALGKAGVRARFVDATEVVACDDELGTVAPDIKRTNRLVRTTLRPLIAARVVPVVPGFIGITRAGHVATLGRGGTDLSATLIGAALGAADITLWKDVPGLLTADPRVVADGRVIPQLTSREAAEIAYYGAKVLHPRALVPLRGRRIPVRVRPFLDPAAAGSEVSPRRAGKEYPVKAVSAIRSQAMVTLSGNGMLGVPGVAARAFGAFHRAGISVSLISQASSEHSICFTVPDESALEAASVLEAAFAEELVSGDVDGVELERQLATIAVVGDGMAGTPGIAARVFGALAAAGINIIAIAQGSSELNISFVVREEDANSAVRQVHDAFQLNRIGGGRMDRRERVDVILLGFGQIGRTLVRMIPRAAAARARLRVVAIVDRNNSIFDARGLTPSFLAELVQRKEGTGRLGSRADGPHSALNGLDAILRIAAHALSHPVLVDLTASDTVPVLQAALAHGMDVVMANKRPLSGPIRDYDTLIDAAAAAHRLLLHETTVGAGLPIIDTIRKLRESGDRVRRIEGCTSGTLGFLFSELQAGSSFADAVARAMQLGYTEPDPRDDLSGLDVARKALILGRLIGFRGEIADVRVAQLLPPRVMRGTRERFLERMGELNAEWHDRVQSAARNGRVLRYVLTATPRRVSVDLRAVPQASPFAGLRGTDNQVVITSDRYRENRLIITGPGAGRDVTAAGVLNDILRVVEGHAVTRAAVRV